MNNVKKNLLNKMATVAKKTAELNADTFCMWWNYQPKKPVALKKYVNFNA